MSDDRDRKPPGRSYRARGRSSPSIVSRHGYVRSSFVGGQNSRQVRGGVAQRWVQRTPMADNLVQEDCSLPGGEEISSDVTNLFVTRNSCQETVGQTAEQLQSLSVSASTVDSKSEMDFASSSLLASSSDRFINVMTSHVTRASSAEEESCDSSYFSTSSVVEENCSTNWLSNEETQHGQSSQKKAVIGGSLGNFDGRASVRVPFDICRQKTGTYVKLKAPLHVKNREKRNEIKRSVEGQSIKILRPGMILLKRYISSEDQVAIVKKCRELGLGSGGFYQPGYREGAKLHLQMMCLGKHWEPEISKYVDQRPIDGAKPPIIPAEFCRLVNMAIQDSYSYLQHQGIARNGEESFPSMSPNICVVNFYTKSGQLGLHQDKDESQESLRRGLPVVSFSIGDAAEFLYCDERDVDKANKVMLESGDVLIFGGKSRHVFHGVTAIHSDTAPSTLLEESNIQSGRLNLTFREY